MAIRFYDSANPGSIPSGAYAAVCIDGRFAWDEYDTSRMSRVFRYTVRGGAVKARYARGIDIEPGCVWPPEKAMPFLIARHKMYGDATAYCDRSTLPQVRQLVADAGIEVFEWVATLDGTQDVEGAWAVQFQGGLHAPYDISVLHGVNNFHAP
jgi:hypothetical protein